VGPGGGAGATVTANVCCAIPPGPVQINTKLPLAVRGPTVSEPDKVLPPDHRSDAAHDVAFVLCHVSVTESPACSDERSPANVTVGAAGGGGVEGGLDPPPPPHPPKTDAIATAAMAFFQR
jgi:hypothetical protein